MQTPRFLARLFRLHQGQMLVMAALMMPAMIAMTGLVLDGGFLYAETRRAQAAADSSAWAGATYVWKNTSANCGSSDTCGAKAYAELLGYTVAEGATVTVAHPAETSGTYAATDYATVGDYVKVTVAYTAPKFFIGIIFPALTEIQASAIAGIARVPSEFALLALGDPCSSDVSLSGSVDIIVNNGAVMSNCTSSTSVQTSGSAILTADAIQTAGGCSGSGISVTCETGVAPIADPMGSMTNPCTSSSAAPLTTYPCPIRDWSEAGVANNDTVVLNPGVWDEMSPSGNGVAWLRQGVYVVKGAVGSTGTTGFKVCGATGSPAGGAPPGDKGKTSDGYGCTSATGGALVFIANSEYDATRANPCDDGSSPSPTAGSATLGGSAGFNLIAMTTGLYSGLALWQGCDNASTISLTGSSGSEVQGTTYAPDATVSLSGNADWTTPSSVVASRFTASGSASVTINYNRNISYKPFAVVLVQ